MLTQYEITHMENLMVRDDYWHDDFEEEDEDDHIVMVHADGSVVYEDGYGPEDDEIVTYCDIYTCADCPRYGDDCDGEEEDDE